MSKELNFGDFNEMISASDADLTNMKVNLAKLRTLSHDDKTEAAMLRSRIDEQSQLIMILKQRTDESSTSIKTLERINKELENFKTSTQCELDLSTRRFNMLDARFNDLASNHEELIKIKDEYKRVNEELRRENFRLKSDNEQLFSKTIEEKDKKLAEMDRKILHLKQQNSTMEIRYRELQKCSTETEETQVAEIKELKRHLSDSEERLKGAEAKLKQYVDKQQASDNTNQAKVQTLTKEKDDLLNLAMSRGKLIQEKQSENKKLEQKIQQMEKAVLEMEHKFERESAEVNVNLKVRRLRAELEEAEKNYQDVTRDFDAFKKHSKKLLQQEKTLNEKLRHLVG